MREIKLLSFLVGIVFVASFIKKQPKDPFYSNGYKHLFQHEKIYHQVLDSINYWIENELKYSIHLRDGFKLDSIFIFNEDSSAFTTTLYERRDNRVTSDVIYNFYGIKVNELWYFFCGATYYTSRGDYQDSITKPMSYKLLSYISHTEILTPSYILHWNGKISPNKDWFSLKLVNGGLFGKKNITDQIEFEKIVKQRAARKYKFKHKDPYSSNTIDEHPIRQELPISWSRRLTINSYQRRFKQMGIN